MPVAFEKRGDTIIALRAGRKVGEYHSKGGKVKALDYLRWRQVMEKTHAPR